MMSVRGRESEHRRVRESKAAVEGVFKVEYEAEGRTVTQTFALRRTLASSTMRRECWLLKTSETGVDRRRMKLHGGW